MANIDTSTIENFDSMTPEEQVKALLGVEIPDPVDMTKFVSKEVFDKKASEAANLSKQLKENSKSGSELQQALDKIAELEKANTIKDYTAKYIGLGYDAALAAETAQAMADGDMAKVFENGEKHRTALEKKIKEDLMNKTPKPGGAGGDDKHEDPAGLAQAKKIGQAKSEANKTASDVLKYYL